MALDINKIIMESIQETKEETSKEVLTESTEVSNVIQEQEQEDISILESAVRHAIAAGLGGIQLRKKLKKSC